MSRINGKFLAVGALTLAAFAVAPMAQAEKGDWLVKAGATMVSPKSNNLKLGDLPVPDLGTLEDSIIQVDDGTSLGLTVTYMMTDNWAIELLAAVPFKHDIKLDATLEGERDTAKIGDTKHLPPTLSLQYHFMPDSMFSPYVGVGFNATLFSSESLNDLGTTVAELLGYENPKLKLDTSTGVAAQVGADFFFSDKWFANVDVRYIDIGTDAKIVGSGTSAPLQLGKVNIDPMVYSLMIGYKF